MSPFTPWQPPPVSVDFWENIMGYRWSPFDPQPLEVAQARILTIHQYLADSVPTFENAALRLRARGALKYAQWDMLLQYLQPYQPDRLALLKDMAPAIIGAGIVAAYVIFAHFYSQRRATSWQTVYGFLEDLDDFALDYPYDTDFYTAPAHYHPHKDLQQSFVGHKRGAGEGSSTGFQFFIPRRDETTFHYAAAQFPLEPITRRFIAVVLTLNVSANAVPRTWSLTLSWPTKTTQLSTTLRFFNIPGRLDYWVDTLEHQYPVPGIPPHPNYKGFQYYLLNIDSQRQMLTDVLIQNYLATKLQLPLTETVLTGPRSPYLWIDVQSEVNQPARLSLGRMFVANWGPPLQNPQIPDLPKPIPADFQHLDPWNIKSRPMLLDHPDYKYYPNTNIRIPTDPNNPPKAL